MEKKYVSIGKETIAYLDEGSGPVVVMVHGNMSSSVHYEPLISRIKDSYRCIALDLRGFGDSTYNERFDTLEELADDVNLFTEALGLDSYYLIGWSNGGGVSLKLCAKYPEKVKKFFDIEGAGLKATPFSRRRTTIPQASLMQIRMKWQPTPCRLAPFSLSLRRATRL
jgi:pimeloyl-ACP methyl ester carboxylesterase